jgi:hypothetical protein
VSTPLRCGARDRAQMTRRRDFVLPRMAADSGGWATPERSGLADTRVALTGELDLATVQVLRGPPTSSCRRRLTRSPSI